MYCKTFQEFKWQSRTTNSQLQRQRKEKKEREKSVNKRRKHRLDITESASAQFPTWIFNFGSYGQPRAVRENLYYDELWATFELFG